MAAEDLGDARSQQSHAGLKIVRRAIDDGYVLVTNNTTDFAPC
jgi:hypothetical protein